MERENVHLLIVEDNPRFLEELLAWVRDEFGYRTIETSTSAAEATQKLQAPCDVVIADMRMERDDSGFAVLDWVKSQNLSTVVIVLTANDTVADCRRAFCAGAWDYISKNMKGSCFETLDASIQAAIAYLDRWGNRPNLQWIAENRADLEARYWGQWIAIANQSIIESADTETELLKRLEERQLRRFTTTIECIGDLPPMANLLQRGEGDRLEFKSTLQWDVREAKENKGLQHGCLKTIAAFLNTEGGVLLIGVEDNGKGYGLEKDLQCLNNGNLDKFERHLVQLIENHIGRRFLPFIKIRFERLAEQDICGVYVQASSRKAFLKTEKGLELHQRTGNATKLVGVPEIYDFL